MKSPDAQNKTTDDLVYLYSGSVGQAANMTTGLSLEDNSKQLQNLSRFYF